MTDMIIMITREIEESIIPVDSLVKSKISTVRAGDADLRRKR